MDRVRRIRSFLISTGKSGMKVPIVSRQFIYGLVLSISLLLLPVTASAYSGSIYLSSFQNIDYTKFLTGEIYYNLSSGPGSPTYYGYCVDKTASLPIPGSYYAETSSITGNTGLLKAAWLIDNYAASKPYLYPGRTSLDTGVALQLAIWDQLTGQGITYESPKYDGYEYLFAMKDYFDGQVNLISTGDLNLLASKYNVLRISTTDASGNHLQDIESLTPVPIPPVFLLFGSSLIGLLGLRRKNTLCAI